MDILELFSHRGPRSYVQGSRKWIPLLPGLQVRIEGRTEEFVVLHVDHKRHVVDLSRFGSMSKVEMGIPITLISAVGEPNPEDDWPDVA